MHVWRSDQRTFGVVGGQLGTDARGIFPCALAAAVREVSSVCFPAISWVSLIVNQNPVPAPIAGWWLARPDLGVRWSSRLVATAAEERLSIRLNFIHKIFGFRLSQCHRGV